MSDVQRASRSEIARLVHGGEAIINDERLAWQKTGMRKDAGAELEDRVQKDAGKNKEDKDKRAKIIILQEDQVQNVLAEKAVTEVALDKNDVEWEGESSSEEEDLVEKKLWDAADVSVEDECDASGFGNSTARGVVEAAALTITHHRASANDDGVPQTHDVDLSTVGLPPMPCTPNAQ